MDDGKREYPIEKRDAKLIERTYRALMAARQELDRSTAAFNAAMTDLAVDLAEEHGDPVTMETLAVDWEKRIATYTPKVEDPA